MPAGVVAVLKAIEALGSVLSRFFDWLARRDQQRLGALEAKDAQSEKEAERAKEGEEIERNVRAADADTLGRLRNKWTRP